MARGKCPPGVICTDTTTVWLILILGAIAVVGLYLMRPVHAVPSPVPSPRIYVVQQPREPIGPIGPIGPVGPVQQVGILTAEGGSSSSAAPDRTILPLYGRELNTRRSRWNYYTRTDGTNPVQVPVRVGNRVCDDDTNGCNEVYSDDTVHVPVLGRSFKATIYRKSLF